MARVKYRPIPPLTEKDIQRFWSKVYVRGPNECWPWRGGHTNNYGAFAIKSENYRANRIAMFITSGVDPGPMSSCHTCDNPECCNPTHLVSGTEKWNHDDMIAKGRAKYATGKAHGTSTHPRSFDCLKGFRHPLAKLRPEDVAEIKRLANGGMRQRDIAAKFSVHVVTIGRALRGETYFHPLTPEIG